MIARRRIWLLVVTVACSGHKPRQDTPRNTTSPPAMDAAVATALPADVTTLTDRWEQCWHFSGEEPYNAARRAEIEAAVAKYCPGNDDERERLRAKYRGNAEVERALQALDEMQ